MVHALDTKCLQERKWWCFFLSSIVTFITGAASVLIVRAFNSVLRKKVGNTFFHFQSDIFGREESMNMEKGGRTVAFWLGAPTVSRLALMFLFLRNKLEKGTRMHQ